MELTHKSIAFEVKVDAASRRISGYGSVFGNKDQHNDIIVPGAFADSLKVRKPAMLYQHWSEKLIGVWDVTREDSKGLYVEGTIAETPLGNEAYTLAKMGALTGMSIGYNPSDFEYSADGKGRTLNKVDLWEVSLVTFPANIEATVTGVKSLSAIAFEHLHECKDKIEAALRDAGASKRVAQYIASLVPTPALRDVAGDELKTTLTHATNILKGLVQ
jgi:HK97 family phage prohead protease